MNRRIRYLSICLSCLVGGSILAESLLATAQQYVPPKRGIPTRREGGGTRGGCMGAGKPLMPLVPLDGFSTAVSDSPTFFWYVPTTRVQAAEFRLLDTRTDEELYATSVPLNSTPGVVSFRLPASITASLKPGIDYTWQFSLLCDPNEPSRNPLVEGLFQRTQADSTLKSQLDRATLADRPSIYATAGIWHDAITTLAQQRCDRPQDSTLLNRWRTLLQSVRLEGYAGESLAPSCSAITNRSAQPNRR
jgi:hypothetical protein